MKNLAGMLIRIVWNLYIELEKISIFMVLTVFALEHIWDPTFPSTQLGTWEILTKYQVCE